MLRFANLPVRNERLNPERVFASFVPIVSNYPVLNPRKEKTFEKHKPTKQKRPT